MALSIFTSTLLPFVFILSAASAAAPDAAGEVEFLDARLDPEASNAVGEGRSFFTSNGQYFVALNTTVVLWSVVTLVGSLVAFLTILSLADKKQQAANTGYSTYERHYDDTPHYEYRHDDHDEVIDFDVNVDNRDQDRYRQNGSNRGRKNNGHRGGRHRPHHYRNKRGAWDRADRDLATMMFELAQAFKKHEVTEPPCQRYVACEASQESRIDQNGSFAKLVNRIMREMDSRHGARAVRAKDSFVYDLLTEFKRGRDAFLIGGIDDACAALRNTCYRTASTKNNESPTGSTSTTSYDHGGYGRSEEFGQKVNF